MYTIQFDDYEFPNLTFELSEQSNDNDIKVNSIIQRHGALDVDTYLKPKRLKIKGILHNAVNTDTRTELNDMNQNLLLQSGNLKFEADRYINCRIQRIRDRNSKGTDKSVLDVNIDAIAFDPFYYAVGLSSVTYAQVAGTNSFYVYNGGGIYTETIVSIIASAGTIADDINVTNLSNNDQQSKYRGTVANGNTLILTSADLTCENNSADGITDFEGEFIQLSAGGNTIQVVGATCTVTVDYRWRWI